MPMIEFSERDILRNTIVTPDWYRVKVESVGEKPASGSNANTSTLYPVEGTILYNAETKDTTFAGVPLSWGFNDNPKAKGFIQGFMKAFGVEIRPGTRFELRAAEGKELDVFVENDTWEGRIVNRVNNKFRQVRDTE